MRPAIGHSTTSQPTNAAGRVFFPPEIASANCCFPPLWMEHFVTQDEFSHPWKCFQAVSKQVYSSFQTHRKVENGTSHGKRKEITPLFEKKKHPFSPHFHPWFCFWAPKEEREEEEAGHFHSSLSSSSAISRCFQCHVFRRVFFWTSSSSSMSVRMWTTWKIPIGSVCWSFFLLLRPERMRAWGGKPLKNEVDTLGWW